MSTADIELSPPASGPVDVLFVAGEHSGDQHAALIARDIQQAHPDWQMAAMGGPSLKLAGVQLLFDLTRHSVVGLVEVLRHYGEFKRIFEALVGWIGAHQPKVVVLVDYPGFNLRLADALRKRGISRKGGGNVAVYQYVSPQIWAWKAKRRFKMAKILDGLGVIFPFELDCYTDTNLPVAFVGHPFARKDYSNPLRYDPEGPILLLPGSRKQAVSRIFPVMLKTIAAYRASGGTRRCVCLYPEDSIRLILEDVIGREHVDSGMVSLRPAEQGTTASAVLTSSGTMSLNCALAGLPGAIVYVAHPFTTWLGRRLVSIEWLGIANLVLGRCLYPEFIQEAAKPEVLATLLRDTLADPEAHGVFSAGSKEVFGKLHATDASNMVTQIVQLVGLD
ncbi:lipid-A-disaccharide synthase [Puniceicoccales bacterium CK1056]|uniref:Lipid-A-disaccharide synthase n=1 Tax=Oceanipulchritudo coccoides TaxID=2706888 RepID=A0A6B2LYL9_9BACT|nr:lipid-A-disaccharide synthase [Oceanipulchritudo coccoides]NDV61781.1 lipid-A-disaccharide synthase [Oceanipulchritudo coccoides]